MDWVGTWGTAMYYGDDSGDEGKASALRFSQILSNSTLRQIIRTSIGGEKMRLNFSNEYGQMTMKLREVRIARAVTPCRSDIDTGTDISVTFNGGCRGTEIPAGGSVVSDAIEFQAGTLERLAVSIYFGNVPKRVACHVGARANSFIVPRSAASEAVLTDAVICTHLFVLSGADVLPRADSPQCRSVVVLGDSITDGYGVEPEDYTRWTDVLAQKLAGDVQTQHLSVINMGIGTNHLLCQKNPAAAQSRFERDVPGQPGVGYFIFFIGINDLVFTTAAAREIIEGYENVIAAAEKCGIKVYGATITPYSKKDTRRREINDWLRRQKQSGKIDGLIDFDALLRDPDRPDFILPVYDNDGLHPNIAAYKAMGELTFTVIKDTIGTD